MISDKVWYPQLKGGESRKWFGNYGSVVNWKNDGKILKTTLHRSGKRIGATNFNDGYQLEREGVSWTKISSGLFSARFHEKGFVFNDASASAFPLAEQELRMQSPRTKMLSPR